MRPTVQEKTMSETSLDIIEKHDGGNCSEEPVEKIPSRIPSEEERYFYEQSYREPVESIARIEEVAKFMVGATATTSGLFLAAFKLSTGSETVSGLSWYIPFLCWGASIVASVLVLFPQKYETGKDEPDSWKNAFIRARKHKFRWLFVGALLFVIGIISAIYPFTQ